MPDKVYMKIFGSGLGSIKDIKLKNDDFLDYFQLNLISFVKSINQVHNCRVKLLNKVKKKKRFSFSFINQIFFLYFFMKIDLGYCSAI